MEDQVNGMEAAQPATKARAWLTPLLCSALCSFTLFVFSPMETYFSASIELWFQLGDFYWFSLLGFALLWGVLFGLAMLLRGRARSALCGLLIGLSLAVYIQGSFANADYGVLNGVAIDWDSFGAYPVWNTLMWALLLLTPTVLCAVLHKKSAFALRFVSVLLSLMLVASTAALVFGNMGRKRHTEPTFTTKNEFALSSGKNTVVFVLDTFDTTSFAKLLSEHPELGSELDGFTWFKKSTGFYPVTTYAMPTLLTGELYLYETTHGGYEKDAWSRDTFLDAFHKNGYEVDVYSESEYAYEEALDTIDNIAVQAIQPDSNWTLWTLMARLTGFRYGPHLLKPSFTISTLDFEPHKRGAEQTVYTFDDALFLSELRAEGISATLDQPKFSLYHLEGAHPGYSLLADGTRGYTTQHVQLMTVMNGLDEIFDQMKAQGVYDDATIAITADHGLIGMDYAPLLLIKRPGDKGALQESEALVTQLDLHNTLATAAGFGDAIGYGEDAFSLTADDLRETSYYDFHWAEGDRMREYNVTLDDEGELLYQATGVLYKYGDQQEYYPKEYALGTQLTFNTAQDALPWMDDIMNMCLKDAKPGAWFGMPNVRLWMQVTDEEYGDLSVTLDVADVIGESQPMKVIYDGMVQETLTVEKGDTSVEFTVPYDSVYDGVLDVTLRFPDAKNDYELSGWESGTYYMKAVAVTGLRVDSSEE